MKIAVVGNRPFLKQELCRELANQKIEFQIDITVDTSIDQSYESHDCDFQDIVSCERLLSGIDCLIHTGLSWRELKKEVIYNQINDLGCIVNEAIKQKIRVIFISDALSSGYHSKFDTYDESKLWNQSMDWSLSGFMYHFAEREIFRGIVEGIEAVIIRPSIMIGSKSDKQAVSDISGRCYDPEDSKGSLSIVSRTDIIQLIRKLIDFDSFEYRFVNCSGHSISVPQFAELIADHETPEERSSVFSSIFNYFKKTTPSSFLGRIFGFENNYC